MSGHHPRIVALRDNQRQLDADGCEVGVSRQALDETLASYEELLAFARLIANFTPPGRDTQDDAETLESLIRSATRLLAKAEGRDGAE